MERNRNYQVVRLLRGYLALWLILVLAGSAAAADGGALTEVGRFEAGIRAGLSLASVGGENLIDVAHWDKTRTGLFGGAFARYSVSRVVSLQMDLAYVMKGAKIVEPITYDALDSVEVTLELNRFELAQIVIFNLPIEGKVRPSLLGGLCVSTLGSTKVTSGDAQGRDMSEEIEETQLGFVVGAELAYQLEKTRLFADVRYSRDFGSSHVADAFEWISQVITVGAGVGFKF